MSTDQVFASAAAFVAELRNLRKGREASKHKHKQGGPKRLAPSRYVRERVLEKTGSRCHICGGRIGEREAWHADHVLAHSGGGTSEVENFLPACATCNNYRWDYASEEFQWILKLGVWLRTEIEKETRVGQCAADQFVKYEHRRHARRRATKSNRSTSSGQCNTGEPTDSTDAD